MGWFNSLYGEGIAYIGLMLVLASSVMTIEGKRGPGLLALAAASAYLACAKAQFAVLTPVLILWWGILAFATAKGRAARAGTAAVTLVITFLLGASAVSVYRNNESVSSQDTLYSALMNGILLYADDPETALEELGLDPKLAQDKGKHPYYPKDAYYCPPRTEMAEEMIYSKVSSVDYLRWYLTHPKAFWQMLNDTAGYSADPMPDLNLYIGELPGAPFF